MKTGKKNIGIIVSTIILIFYFLSYSYSPYLQAGKTQLTNAIIDSPIDNEFKDDKMFLYSENREAYLSIGNYYTPYSESFTNNVLTLKYNNYDVHYYTTSDGIEFDIVLYYDARPNVVFNFPLELEGLEAYYQPSLYFEEYPKSWNVNETHAIDDNGTLIDYRPINIVNSYALYYTNKINNEYKTGKVFHIYRPLVHDLNYNFVMYAEMYITPYNELQIYVPEEMFIYGEYPITVDPSIGKSDKGGSSYNLALDKSVTLRTSNPEASAVDITSITAYIYNNQAGTRQGKAGLYDHDAGNDRAGNLLVGSDEENFAFGYDNWRTFSNSAYSGLASGSCWLALLVDDTLTIYFDTGAANSWRYKDMTYPTFLDPWGVPSWSTNRLFSIYANYTITGGVIFNVTHNELVVTNIDTYNGDNSLFMYKWYEFRANLTEGNYTLSTNEIAFTDNTKWCNASFDYDTNTFSRIQDYVFVDLNVTSSYNTTDIHNNILLYYHIMIKGHPDNVFNISLYIRSENSIGNVTGWEEIQDDYAHILKKVHNASIAPPITTVSGNGGDIIIMSSFLVDNAVLIVDIIIIALGIMSIGWGMFGVIGIGIGVVAVMPQMLTNTLDTFTLNFSVISLLAVVILFLLGAGYRLRE